MIEILKWFDKNLLEPDRFNRSSSKGFYRRATRGIAWLRDTATDCVSRMHHLKDILEAHGHQVSIIRENSHRLRRVRRRSSGGSGALRRYSNRSVWISVRLAK